MLRCDRNRNSGGVACLLEVISVMYKKHFFPREIKNIFVEILLPKAKLLIVGIIYRPPNQSNFLEIINTNFDKLDINSKESHILGDFNINMYQNNKYIVHNDKMISFQRY